MSSKKIHIYSNGTIASMEMAERLEEKLDKAGYDVSDTLDNDVELITVIGGDGTFLEAIHRYNFPKIPFIGINTGHLGFFQEIMPNQLDDFIFHYSQDKYTIQELSTVEVLVRCQGKTYHHAGLNEIAIKGNSTHSAHLGISIGGSFIQRFSGDGIVIATPAGSTAYNYSLGGAIVDPRLKVLQVTPIAPMNTIAYRSFTSSILLPAGLSIGIVPENIGLDTTINILFDGYGIKYDAIDEIEVGLAEDKARLLRFDNYDFWTKVKSKFLL